MSFTFKKSITALGVILTGLLCDQVNASENSDGVDYQIMVQRATQAAIWAMPGVALVDFDKATKRDLGGTVNDFVYLTVAKHLKIPGR